MGSEYIGCRITSRGNPQMFRRRVSVLELLREVSDGEGLKR